MERRVEKGTIGATVGATGISDACDTCGKGKMTSVITSMPLTLEGVRVLVPGVLAYRCDRCGELEWSGPECDRARFVAKLLLARRVA